MLPSTGYFKGLNCPFYEYGSCERPYCHFRHTKKEPPSTAINGIESGPLLQKLAPKGLQKTGLSTATGQAQSLAGSVETSTLPVTSKATYNPTPISELNRINNADAEINEEANEQRRRHIPVPYTPRKPASILINRPCEEEPKPFIYIPPPVTYTPGTGEGTQPDPYTPKGTVESKETYLPGKEQELQQYQPKETSASTKRNYVPSDKSVSKKKILEYKPTKLSAKENSSFTYQPTPKELVPCFSSDEDEPDSKRKKISDLNGLDDLGPEFDMLDEILDEEKPFDDINDKNNIEKPNKHVIKNNIVVDNKKEKSHTVKSDKNKSLSDKKSSTTKEKEKLEKKEKHKSSSKDKNKDDSRHKHSSEKKSDKKDRHSSERKDDKKSKHSSSLGGKSDKKERHTSSDSKNDRNDKHTSDSKSDKNNRHTSSDRINVKKEKHSSSHKKTHSSSKSDSNSRHSKEKSTKTSDRHSSSHSSKSKMKNGEHKKEHKSSKSKKNEKEDSKLNKDCNSDTDFNTNDDLILEEEISDADEESIELECKRIFEEYVPTKINENVEELPTKVEEINENEYIPGKKRVSRTIDRNIKIIPKAPLKPDHKFSAAQTMAERLAKIREYHASRAPLETSNIEAQNVKPDILKSSFNTPSSGSSKIRIAHVPYASTLLNAKKTITPTTSIKPVNSEPSTSTTIVQTAKKGAQRVAHMPSEKFIDRPGVLEPLASKIPANIRSTYLNMMIDECLKIYLAATDGYARAQHEELATSKKCSSIQIYKNSALLAVNRLRKEIIECKGVKKSGSDCTMLQKLPQGLSGKNSNSGTWSIQRKNVVDTSKEFSGAKLYKNIEKWVLTEEQLHDNGFPRSHPSGEKGRAIIHTQRKQNPPVGFVRTCCRCKKNYTVDKKGLASVKEECVYHPNNKYRVRGELKYQCCSQDGMSDGCCVAPSHVYEYVDYENLRGYVKTLPPEKSMDDYGVYSLDCEMCYTTQGLDLTRITVIDSSCNVIYETLVKPLHAIVDYNTRYSGITEEQMSNVKTTLLEVQATLLMMFNSKTILIGHSLESDFKALKLIHDTVIDTSVLFPHKLGPPYKRALRNLSSEHLRKIIQNSVDGHDSAEDARVCMELLHYKLKEDLKTR